MIGTQALNDGWVVTFGITRAIAVELALGSEFLSSLVYQM